LRPFAGADNFARNKARDYAATPVSLLSHGKATWSWARIVGAISRMSRVRSWKGDMTNERRTVGNTALDILFRKARSHSGFEPDSVSDAQLRAIYDIMKHGPTTANSQPQRILFLRSVEAKQRIAPAIAPINRDKTLAAPVVAIFAYDLKFPDHLPRFYHNKDAQKWYTKTPEHTEQTAFRNASLQAAYFIIAARAIGLDCGPMSGFDNAKVDAEFFPEGQFKSNFLCNLGKGDPSNLPPVNERFAFDEVCKIV
jgi:3-hydroxypropanoate dehydrogenase